MFKFKIFKNFVSRFMSEFKNNNFSISESIFGGMSVSEPVFGNGNVLNPVEGETTKQENDGKERTFDEP